MGLCNKTLTQIIEPFKLQAAKLQKAKTQQRTQSGNLCPKCGRQLPAGSKFCPYDGTIISRECPNCKFTNVPDARFCANCGAKL
ncbi:MAG: zinc ribbon domain-containing protein [Candidatus Promineifilaceae bacterium]